MWEGRGPWLQVHPCGSAKAKNVLEIAVVPACLPHPETPWQSRPACVGYKDPFCLYGTFLFTLEDLILGRGSRGSSAWCPCPHPPKFLLPITLLGDCLLPGPSRGKDEGTGQKNPPLAPTHSLTLAAAFSLP